MGGSSHILDHSPPPNTIVVPFNWHLLMDEMSVGPLMACCDDSLARGDLCQFGKVPEDLPSIWIGLRNTLQRNLS